MQNQLFSISLWGLWGLLVSSGGTVEYHFIAEPKTWPEAQMFCREHYTDLATVSSLEAVIKLEERGNRTGPAWIGLYDDPASWKRKMTDDSNSWRWSANGTTSPGGYQNWRYDQPDCNKISETCVAIFKGFWHDAICSNLKPFVCSTGTGENKTFEVVDSHVTWGMAVAHCRARRSELATIESPDENTKADSVTTRFTHKAWIGLYRDAWRWSDNTPVKFTIWKYGGDIRGRHCAAQTLEHLWKPTACKTPLPFFCQAESVNPDSSATTTRPENEQQSTAPDTVTTKDIVLLVTLTTAVTLMFTSAAVIALYLLIQKKIIRPPEPPKIPKCEVTSEEVYENVP